MDLFPAEDFGIVRHHPRGDFAMLTPAFGRKLSPTEVQFREGRLETEPGLFARRSKVSGPICFFQHVAEEDVFAVRPVVAGPVTAIVADIEGLVSLRGTGMVRNLLRIHVEDVGCLGQIGLNGFASRLGRCRNHGQEKDSRGKKETGSAHSGNPLCAAFNQMGVQGYIHLGRLVVNDVQQQVERLLGNLVKRLHHVRDARLLRSDRAAP